MAGAGVSEPAAGVSEAVGGDGHGCCLGGRIKTAQRAKVVRAVRLSRCLGAFKFELLPDWFYLSKVDPRDEPVGI